MSVPHQCKILHLYYCQLMFTHIFLYIVNHIVMLVPSAVCEVNCSKSINTTHQSSVKLNILSFKDRKLRIAI